MPNERATSSEPNAYRLMHKKTGEVVLQAGYAWVEIDDDLNETSGVGWVDVPAAEEE